MKSIKFFLINLFAVCGIIDAAACWYGAYSPGAYYMYRVCDLSPTPLSDTNKVSNPGANRNCQEWQRLTSSSIPLEDIYNVVYTMSLEDYEAMYSDKDKTYQNKFAEWITKQDTTILDFLLLAKTNEHIRAQHNSRWYYPSMKTGTRMTIEEVVAKSLSVEDNRLRDRYLLQAVRALFTMGKFQECIDLWESEISLLPQDNLMRQLSHPYIAGAEFNVNRTHKAIEYFAQLGDIPSIQYCAKHSGDSLSAIDALELVCQYAPNSDHISTTLQTHIRRLEPKGGGYDTLKITDDFNRLYSLSIKMGRDRRSENPAMWFYTAAFLADLKGEVINASYLLSLAEKSKSSEFIDESITVFRIYLDAKLKPYNTTYEELLYEQLVWLDSKIVNNIDDYVIEQTASESKLFRGESYYYWNDMMRRIVLSEVCPRMIKAGKTTRALQLANMADNYLYNIVDQKKYNAYVLGEDGKYNTITTTYTNTEYRYSNYDNSFDYCNYFFEMIDSVGVNQAIKYVQNVQKPKSDFDRFLNERGYTGSDYLNDILGTQCLRNLRYAEAVKYLGLVSKDYSRHLNVYMTYDPFCVERKKITPKVDFRYDFACEMLSLQQAIDTITDPNEKARLITKYATGIRNSFGDCWALTQYYKGDTFEYQICEKRKWEKAEITLAAMDKSTQLISLAAEIATDDELAADIHYQFCNFGFVATRYPDTQKGRLVRGHCDNLPDYHPELYL